MVAAGPQNHRTERLVFFQLILDFSKLKDKLLVKEVKAGGIFHCNDSDKSFFFQCNNLICTHSILQIYMITTYGFTLQHISSTVISQ